MKKILGTIGALIGFGLYLFAGDNSRRNHGRQAVRIEFVAISNSDITVKGVFYDMDLKEGQRVDLQVAPKTAHGHAANIEPGSGRWVSSDESVISVEQDPNDELKAIARGLDGSANESVTVDFRADGKVGEGVSEVIGTLSIVCTSGDATVFDITAGTPVDDVPVDNTGAGTGDVVTEGGTATTENPGNIPAEGSTDQPSESPTTDGTPDNG